MLTPLCLYCDYFLRVFLAAMKIFPFFAELCDFSQDQQFSSYRVVQLVVGHKRPLLNCPVKISLRLFSLILQQSSATFLALHSSRRNPPQHIYFKVTPNLRFGSVTFNIDHNFQVEANKSLHTVSFIAQPMGLKNFFILVL